VRARRLVSAATTPRGNGTIETHNLASVTSPAPPAGRCRTMTERSTRDPVKGNHDIKLVNHPQQDRNHDLNVEIANSLRNVGERRKSPILRKSPRTSPRTSPGRPARTPSPSAPLSSSRRRSPSSSPHAVPDWNTRKSGTRPGSAGHLGRKSPSNTRHVAVHSIRSPRSAFQVRCCCGLYPEPNLLLISWLGN
jgi:hypothetical protein